MDYGDINNILKNLEIECESNDIKINNKINIDKLNKNKEEVSNKLLSRNFEFSHGIGNSRDIINFRSGDSKIPDDSQKNNIFERNNLNVKRNMIPIMDYNNFSENYRNKGSDINNKINDSINNRDKIPSR